GGAALGSQPRDGEVRVRGLVRIVAGLAAALWIALAAAPDVAAQACDTGGLRTQERPDPEGVATRVRIGVLVADVIGVNDVDQSAQVDLIGVLEWHDPRLADLAGCRVPRTSIWFPRIEMINSNQLLRERS